MNTGSRWTRIRGENSRPTTKVKTGGDPLKYTKLQRKGCSLFLIKLLKNKLHTILMFILNSAVQTCSFKITIQKKDRQFSFLVWQVNFREIFVQLAFFYQLSVNWRRTTLKIRDQLRKSAFPSTWRTKSIQVLKRSTLIFVFRGQ